MVADTDKELIDLQEAEGMLEAGKTTSITELALNILQTDRYPERECGKTGIILDENNYKL